MTKLSICIPTYNRSKMLCKLLDSIVAQGLPELEVVVSDDASPDDTASIVQPYRKLISRFIYIRQPKNIGLDANFLAMVEAATGDYVWLMGDDDRVEPGGAQRVLDALDRWPGVAGLTLGVIDYDSELNQPVGLRNTPPTQAMQGAAEVFSRISDLLGFMSALVIDRAKWRTIANDPATGAFNNYYLQVYIIGRALEQDGGWGVVQEPCVGFRTDNDQFRAKFGWIKRLKIDVDAYEQIGQALFADNPTARLSFRKGIFNTHVIARITNAKIAPGPTPGVWQAARLLFGPYRGLSKFWLRALPALYTPKWVIRGARLAYKRLSPSSGIARAQRIAAASHRD